MTSGSINLSSHLATVHEHWSPKVVGQFNGHNLMVVKVKGEFAWHKHDNTDDFFQVLQGHLRIEMPDRAVELNPGEIFIVPRGVMHRPIAEHKTQIMLIEPEGTDRTGD